MCPWGDIIEPRRRNFRGHIAQVSARTPLRRASAAHIIMGNLAHISVVVTSRSASQGLPENGGNIHVTFKPPQDIAHEKLAQRGGHGDHPHR